MLLVCYSHVIISSTFFTSSQIAPNNYILLSFYTAIKPKLSDFKNYNASLWCDTSYHFSDFFSNF